MKVPRMATQIRPLAGMSVRDSAHASGTPVQRIGRIEALPGLRVLDGSGQPMTTSSGGFDHFSQDGNTHRSSAT